MIRFAVAALLACGCDRAPPLTSCTDDLRGIYEVDGRRWMILDHRRTLEAYPLFDDNADRDAVSGLEVAPRVIDFERARADAITGTVRRRFLRGTLHCEGRAPARIVRCEGAKLEVVLADPAPPLAFAPCKWPPSPPTRRERWVRE